MAGPAVTGHEYDFKQAIRDTRAAMERTDLVTLATITLAKSHAGCAIDQFTADELPTIAKSMLHSTACLGMIVQKIPGISTASYSTANIVLNVSACAAVMILDHLEIDSLEASLAACSNDDPWPDQPGYGVQP